MSLSLDEDDKKEKKKPEKKEAKGLDDDLGDEIVEKAFDPLNPEGVVLDTEPNKANPSDALTIAGALGTLAGRDLFSDVTFVVGKGGEQRSIPGHRLILAASSDIFEAMLYPPKFPGDKKAAGDGKKPKSSAVSPSKEAKGKDGLGLDKGSLDDDDRLSIEIPDVRPNIFKIMLQAVYSDTADIKPEDLPELIACANKFQLESLRALCVTFMEEGVTAENACKLFETAQELLKEKHFALEFIEEHAEDVARSAGWDTLPKDRLMTILQDDKLCIEEVDLFKAVLRWGLCECKRQGLSDTTDNKKKVLKDILPLIRFPIMMMEEIATFVSPTQLLEAPQLLEIFTYLGKKDKAGASSLKVGFPTRPRGGARDKWALDQNLKWNTVTLSNKDRTAANSGSNHSYCQGTIAWTKGKHAWRVYRDSGNTQWLFIGMARKVNHTQYSYNDATVWGLSSASQQYMASASSSVNTNFATGPLDCLYDADAGTMTITNLTGGQTHNISNLPRGGEGLVPHFGPHSAQTISVYPISVKEVGKADVDPRKRT